MREWQILSADVYIVCTLLLDSMLQYNYFVKVHHKVHFIWNLGLLKKNDFIFALGWVREKSFQCFKRISAVQNVADKGENVQNCQVKFVNIIYEWSTSRSHGWRIDTDEQDAHEMLHVLLTSLEEEAQKGHDSAASRTASLSFYDCIIGNTYVRHDNLWQFRSSKRYVCANFDKIRQVV